MNNSRFDDVANNDSPLVNQLQSLLNGVNETLTRPPEGVNDGHWTVEIKQKLATLGRRMSYYVCSSGGDDADWGEWLYDHCWLDYAKNDLGQHQWGKFNAIILAVESEWGSEAAVLDDFEKLLQSRAQYKLMIFQAWGGIEDAQRRFKDLEATARHYGMLPKETYLLACWCPSPAAHFEFHIFSNS